MTDSLNDLTPEVLAALKRVFGDFETLDRNRTSLDDLNTLEKAGLMFSRVLTEDDDFCMSSLDGFEPGETFFEFTARGSVFWQKLRQEARQ